MPKISLYKGIDGTVVPVNGTTVITGYKCPWTKKIYKTKKSYLNHLKTLRKNIIQKNKREKIYNKKKNELFNKYSFDEIIEWIHINPDFLLHNIRNLVHNYDSIRDDFIIEITKLDIRWSECVENTHDCPKGGVRNFEKLSHIPQGYPGWEGTIEFVIFPNIGNGFGILRGIRIFTGDGSAQAQTNNNTGKTVYNCSIKMFSDDWPNLYNGMIHDMIGYDDPYKAKRYIYRKKEL